MISNLKTMTDLELATHAALEAGKLLRENFGLDAAVDEATHHDIKLALDKESQTLITKILLEQRPGDALYGEEGLAGNLDSERQWIVDPWLSAQSACLVCITPFTAWRRARTAYAGGTSALAI